MSTEPLHWFKSFTTLGGIGQIIGSTEKHWKVFWTILTLTFLAITGYSALLIVIEYSKFYVVTSFSVVHQDRLVIPSVTICNVNRVHCGHLLKKLEDYDKANETRKEMLCKLFKLTGCDTTTKVKELTMYGNIASNFGICDVPEYNYALIDALHERLKQDEINQAFMEIYFKLNRTELSDLAHSPESTIKKCSLGSITVTDQCKQTMDGRNATRILTPRYGVCYLHNFEPLNSNARNEAAGSSGPDYGLNLILDIQSHQYMRYGLSQTNGMILTLNDPNAMPMVLAKPIHLAPNIQTGIKILKQTITRQKFPYTTDCSDTYPKEYLENKHLGNFTYVKYSNDHCKSLCRVIYVLEACGCLDPLMLEGIFLSQLEPVDDTLCSVVTNSEQRICAVNATVNYSNGDGDDTCPCKPDCNTDNFEYAISETKWPSDQYWAVLAEHFGVTYKGQQVTYKLQQTKELSGETDEDFEQIQQLVQNNLMQVSIYYGSLDVDHVAETPEYTFLTFLSSLGGAVSLYLGISFIQVFEVVEFMIKLCASCFSQNVKK